MTVTLCVRTRNTCVGHLIHLNRFSLKTFHHPVETRLRHMQTLGTINVIGTIIPVVLATKEEAGAENLDENGFAAYGWETATIVLRVWPDKVRHASARFGDLCHEAVHAIMVENGGSHVIQRYCPHFTSEQCDELEEELVRRIAPGIVTAIDDLIELRAALVDLEAGGQ